MLKLPYYLHITIEFIDKYVGKNWNWDALSEDNKITLKFIEKSTIKSFCIANNIRLFYYLNFAKIIYDI